MPQKQFALDERTSITIYKRKGNRNLRLTISADGNVRVSMPSWLPYATGVQFAKSRKSWIEEQRKPSGVLLEGQSIGKVHHLRFVARDGSRIAGRVRASEVLVTHPVSVLPSNMDVQKVAEKAATKALRLQAEQLLPRRLQELAEKHGFRYRSVSIKRLKSRWGSCDHEGNIVLNLFLMQLPWECIDYVLLHELTHTRLMRHGPDFWKAMEEVLPGVSRIRKTMRTYRPVLDTPIS